MFPLDDKFVFGDILFFWLIFSNFLRNERRGVLVRAAAEAAGRRLGRRLEAAPPPRPRSGQKPIAAHSAKTLQNTQPKRTKYSPKTNLLIQRKHRYAYDMTFLCPHHPWLSTDPMTLNHYSVYLSLINMNFLLRNLFSGLTLF